MKYNEFKNILKIINLELKENQMDLLNKYFEELINYNKHTNLTAIVERKEVFIKHFFDSLTISQVIDLKNCENLLDIGTGAGFPGVVLKIFYPHLKITLLDSNQKKINFLKMLVSKLELNDVNFVNDRVENYSRNNLNKYDIVTARAVSNLAVLTELAMPLVKENKYFIPLKGSNLEEINNGLKAIEVMHGQIKEIFSLELPENMGRRNVIKIQKKRITKIDELRSYEKIIKKPLQNNCK